MRAARDANVAQLCKRGFSRGMTASWGKTELVCSTIQAGKKREGRAERIFSPCYKCVTFCREALAAVSQSCYPMATRGTRAARGWRGRGW